MNCTYYKHTIDDFRIFFKDMEWSYLDQGVCEQFMDVSHLKLCG